MQKSSSFHVSAVVKADFLHLRHLLSGRQLKVQVARFHPFFLAQLIFMLTPFSLESMCVAKSKSRLLVERYEFPTGQASFPSYYLAAARPIDLRLNLARRPTQVVQA